MDVPLLKFSSVALSSESRVIQVLFCCAVAVTNEPITIHPRPNTTRSHQIRERRSSCCCLVLEIPPTPDACPEMPSAHGCLSCDFPEKAIPDSVFFFGGRSSFHSVSTRFALSSKHLGCGLYRCSTAAAPKVSTLRRFSNCVAVGRRQHTCVEEPSPPRLLRVLVFEERDWEGPLVTDESSGAGHLERNSSRTCCCR